MVMMSGSIVGGIVGSLSIPLMFLVWLVIIDISVSIRSIEFTSLSVEYLTFCWVIFAKIMGEGCGLRPTFFVFGDPSSSVPVIVTGMGELVSKLGSRSSDPVRGVIEPLDAGFWASGLLWV